MNIKYLLAAKKENLIRLAKFLKIQVFNQWTKRHIAYVISTRINK